MESLILPVYMDAARSPVVPSHGKSLTPSVDLAYSEANAEMTALSYIKAPSGVSRIGTRPPLISLCH